VDREVAVNQVAQVQQPWESTIYRKVTLEARRGAVPAVGNWLQSEGRGSLYHQPGWLKLIESHFGHETYTIYSHQDGRVNGVLPLVRLKSLLFGDYMVSLPFFNYGGACGQTQWLERELMGRAVQLARQLGVSHVEFRDTVQRAFPGPVRSHKVAMVRDLPADPDALWKEVGSKRRAQVRRALKEGAAVSVGGLELLNPFYRVFSRNMRDLGTPVYGRRFFREILERFPDNARLIVITLHGAPAAAGFLLAHRDRMEIPWASSLRETNRYGANMLLYWEVLKYSIEQGFAVFDFGRSTPDGGTYRFKRQWGGQPKPLYWHYWLREGGGLPELNPNNPRYALAIRAWKRLPVSVTRLIGPMIVKSLP
jgi:serine/alanine adding enzyme